MRTGVIAAALIAIAASASAIDHPVVGSKLTLRRTSGGDAKLAFVSKDASLLFPAIGGPDDPTSAGLVVELLSSTEPAGASLVAPPGVGKPGWTVRDGTVDSYRFVNRNAPGAPSPIRMALLKQGRGIKVVAKETGVALMAPQGAIAVRLTTGSVRHCARFDGPTIVSDLPGRFVARNALPTALADCSDAALGALVTTTSTSSSTTTTTALGVCGDGIVNQPTEVCDGDSRAACYDVGGADCRPAGFPGECECCGGRDVGLLGCCNPYSVLLPAPDGAGTCVPTRCDPPFTCDSNQCLPSGDCCTVAGNITVVTAYGSPIELNACCPGLIPGMFHSSGFGIACCVDDGQTCTSDAECCSLSCNDGFTCDP